MLTLAAASGGSYHSFKMLPDRENGGQHYIMRAEYIGLTVIPGGSGMNRVQTNRRENVTDHDLPDSLATLVRTLVRLVNSAGYVAVARDV